MKTLAGMGAVCFCMVSAVAGTFMRPPASPDALEATAANALSSAIRQAVAPPTFKRLCVPCHGEKGQGNGPAAVAFNPPPANLTDHDVVSKQTDAELHGIITNGKGSMPAFGAVLKPEEIDTLVSYIRKLSGGKADQGTDATDADPIRSVVHAPFPDVAEVVVGDHGQGHADQRRGRRTLAILHERRLLHPDVGKTP